MCALRVTKVRHQVRHAAVNEFFYKIVAASMALDCNDSLDGTLRRLIASNAASRQPYA